MDIAYDHVQEAVLEAGEEDPGKKAEATEKKPQSLNSEFEEAYKAISASPWGARFGAFMGTVKKQVRGFHFIFALPFRGDATTVVIVANMGRFSPSSLPRRGKLTGDPAGTM